MCLKGGMRTTGQQSDTPLGFTRRVATDPVIERLGDEVDVLLLRLVEQPQHALEVLLLRRVVLVLLQVLLRIVLVLRLGTTTGFDRASGLRGALWSRSTPGGTLETAT
jgi:hypothetical protein